MDEKSKQKIIDNARNYLNEGWHCSEGILKAVGEYYFPDLLPAALKFANPFAGGIGDTHNGMCGALSGGLMVIGVMYGRTDLVANDAQCLSMAAAYHEKFFEHFGYKRCKDLRKYWIGEPGQLNCAELTAQAAMVLLEILEK